ncbi:hypothetical protein J8F10_11355 [Gemmata sp. G18]|uniref:DUF5658 domain-containing protein n=1 Tax=Gemmata palustris TaxID=2822762 RepID=A0ABS5BQ58_9BACT|nr:DUF5658 family protein [Gemmata palustris]MBP3955882.1 hypothetical protein [Gemmata palustris]
MFWKIFVLLGLGVFVLLSAADWVFTFTLLRTHPSAIESNPLAAACLEQYGWNGLAVYKAFGVLALILSVVLILRRRPVVAAGVVTFGCAALLSVTTYSHQMLCDLNREARELKQTEWPQNELRAPSAADNSPIPDRCWFADDVLAATKPATPIATAQTRPHTR